MQLLSDAHVTHVTYVLILYSIAFLLFLCKLPMSLTTALPRNHSLTDPAP